MSNPKVSVIIPVYNVERYIERCAISLFEQTLDSIEYLFIDDCTPDNSIKVLKDTLSRYPKRIPCVKIYQMNKNSGQAFVRRFGIEHAKGEYIIHCDPDDWIEVTLYKKMYEKAKEDDFDLVRCYFVRTDGHKVIPCAHIPEKCYEDPKQLISYLLQGKSMTSLCDKMVKRNLYQGIVFPTSNMQEDAAIVTQLLGKSHHCALLPEVGYYYYVNPSSISKSIKEEAFVRRLQDVKNNAEIIFSFIESMGLTDFYKKEIICHKLNVRNHILYVLHSSSLFRIWNNTYPEIDKYVLFNPLISNIVKLYFVLTKTRIMQLILMMKRNMHKKK